MTNPKRKKQRVAFRKNRQKTVRKQNLTRELLDAGLDADESVSGERLSGKGELSRYRTIIGAEGDDATLRAVDDSVCLRGRVLSAAGLHCFVRAEDGGLYECTVRRVLRTMVRDARNTVVTGDEVLFRPSDGAHGVIERVNARRCSISRQARNKEHIIVSNVDQVLIVVSAGELPLKSNLVDRYLISAEEGGVRSIVCINKMDLADVAGLAPTAGMYARLGYHVVLTSAVAGWGIDQLRVLLKDRITAVTGQSGVGKSSLLNALEPSLELPIAEISAWTQKGRHTTSRAVLLELKSGGSVVDTPGIRQFDLWDVLPEEADGYFVEFRPFVRWCKFPDCSHIHEEGCGVKRAVDSQLIALPRYESYLKIVRGE